MYNSTFTLEAITPVFMRGANQNKAEIRAASIKGLMRWWFRALSGSYFGNDVEGLRRVEEYVFGSTKRESRVVVEVVKEHVEERFCPLPMVWKKKKGVTTRVSQRAIAPGSKFTLLLTSDDEEVLKLACYSLIGLVYFGGIGFRCSRGAGSLKISSLKSDVQLIDLPKNKNQLGQMVNDLTVEIAKILKKTFLCDHENKNCTSYSSFWCFYLFLWGEKAELEEVYYRSNNLENERLTLLDLFEKEFKNKNNHLSNYGYRDFVFGLPRGTKKDRRASPIKVGITELSEKYHVRVSVFKTKIFKPGMNVKWDNIFVFLENIGAEIIYPER